MAASVRSCRFPGLLIRRGWLRWKLIVCSSRGGRALDRSWHESEVAALPTYVGFSNRPFRVKRFQTIHRYSVDVAHGLVLLFGIGTRGPSIMGFEDEVEQSIGRPCRQTNGRSKQTCELTSSIVPRGTSFHRSVELECPSIGLDAARFSCCCCGLLD